MDDFPREALSAEDRKQLAHVLPGEVVDVPMAEIEKIKKDFAQAANVDSVQRVSFPLTAAASLALGGVLAAMIIKSGGAGLISLVWAVANTVVESVGHGVADTKFSAHNAANKKLAGYYNGLMEEGYTQACHNLIAQTDEKISRGIWPTMDDLALLCGISSKSRIWNDSSMALRITVMQARQAVAYMRSSDESRKRELRPATFENMILNKNNFLHQEVIFERLASNLAHLEEDDAHHIPYLPARHIDAETFKEKEHPFLGQVQTLLWGAWRGVKAAYFENPPPLMDLPQQITIPLPDDVDDLGAHIANYEAQTGERLDLPVLKR